MKISIILFSLIFVSSCFDRPNQLQRVIKSGELKVLIRNIPGVYYEGPFGPIGFDYELAKEFANSIGVKLVLINKQNISAMFDALKNQQADMATGRIIKTTSRGKHFSFSKPYQYLDQTLVYSSGTKKIKTSQQLDKLMIEVINNSSQEELLVNLKKTLYPNIDWHVNDDSSVENLLQLVDDKFIDFTIANSHEIKINRRFYPELIKGINLAQNQPVSWAFSQSTEDLSLVNAANKFLSTFQKSQKMTILTERYHGHFDKFNYVDIKVFQRHIITRLPKFKAWFEKAGKDQKIDWNLLAAISYQESHWKTDAISPTGVKGLMMLTLSTAKYIGVSNRLSAYQSIFGGAEYYANLLKRLPDSIKEQDKFWFALVAYNLGYGHLSDARKLCKKRGLDNTKWVNLKQILPLLQRAKWYSQTRYGYARGRGSVIYVKNIRKYYDILKWKSEKEKPAEIKILENLLPAI